MLLVDLNEFVLFFKKLVFIFEELVFLGESSK
jgi:hypothetical protein